MRWQCTRCEEAGEFCEVNPVGVCQRCKTRKHGCSLMPDNPTTGKTDRRAKSKEELFMWRKDQARLKEKAKEEEASKEKQVAKRAAKVKTGKQRARNYTDSGEASASASAASPLELSGLQMLALESGDSSAVNTPADSPGTLLQPPSPGRPAHRISKRSPGEFIYKLSSTAPASHSTHLVLKLPAAPRLPEAAHQKSSYSRGDASQASGAGDNTSRIAALETKQEALERKQATLEEEKKQLQIRVSNLERKMERLDG